MKPIELSTLTGVQLLDVRLPDDYEAAHLAGAQNNCVFEVAFAGRLADTAPDPTKVTVVYGANTQTSEASIAADKLQRLGYNDVQILEGGLAGADGLEIIRGAPLSPPPALPHGIRPIDLAESRMEWLGRNLLNKHWGTVTLESGHLVFENGSLIGGEFLIDLTRLSALILPEPISTTVLIAHLHNDDFFDVANHPKATFVITEVTPTAEPSPGSANLNIIGDLTIRGRTNQIEFTTTAGLTEEGKPAAQAAFSIDRTRWGILYGSGKFFHRLAGHVVNDQLEFQLRIVTV